MKYYFLFLLIALFLLVLPLSIQAASYPKPTGYVNDFAGLYSAQFRQTLETDLKNFDAQTGNEIAVAAVASLEGEDIEGYAVKLFEQWKIGKKGKDNGLLILISRDDRKIRIEVGYGLEGVINDGRAGDIIRNVMTPYFKQSDYETGTKLAVEKLKAYISGEDTSQPVAETKDSPRGPPLGDLLFPGIIFLTYGAGYLGRSKEIWPGAAIGSVVGGGAGYALFNAVPAVFGGIVIFGLLGLFLDWILSRTYQYNLKHGNPNDFWHSRGGFYSSGGGWGGGRSGGGFGGFGGGRSGGGGASGGW